MLFISFLALAAQSTAAQPERMVPPHRWTLDFGRASCTLARRVGGQDSPIVAVNAPLGREPGELLIMGEGSGLDRRLSGELQIRLDRGDPLVARSARERRGGLTGIRLAPMPDNFLDRLAGARQLVVSKGDDAVLAVELGSVGEAVTALNRCNEDLLRSWGIDVAARSALQRKPRLMNADWLLSIAPHEDVTLVLTADVSETGRALDCRVVVSSGNARMDRAVCTLVRTRARFEPATGSEGRPVRAQYVTRVTWQAS